MQTEDLKENTKQTTAEEHLSRKLKRLPPMRVMEPRRLPKQRVRELLQIILLNRTRKTLRSKNCRTVF